MPVWDTIGKIRMTPKGQFDSSSTYEILDVVMNSSMNKLYIAKQAVPANSSLDNTTYWTKILDMSYAAPYNTVIADSTARTISEGTSSTYSVTNLTSDHVVAVWRFSGGYTDNNPPGDITVTTANGSYTIAASNLLASGITMQPIFIKT